MNEENKQELDLLDLEKVKAISPEFKGMVETGLITEQGFRIGGIGVLVKKLNALAGLQDKTNLKLHFIEKKLGGDVPEKQY